MRRGHGHGRRATNPADGTHCVRVQRPVASLFGVSLRSRLAAVPELDGATTV